MVSGADLVSALRQQRRELESKCTSASARLRKIREETGFLWVGDNDSSLLVRDCCPVVRVCVQLYKKETEKDTTQRGKGWNRCIRWSLSLLSICTTSAPHVCFVLFIYFSLGEPGNSVGRPS